MTFNCTSQLLIRQFRKNFTDKDPDPDLKRPAGSIRIRIQMTLQVGYGSEVTCFGSATLVNTCPAPLPTSVNHHVKCPLYCLVKTSSVSDPKEKKLGSGSDFTGNSGSDSRSISIFLTKHNTKKIIN